MQLQQKFPKLFQVLKHLVILKRINLLIGELAEWSNAAVLKTVEAQVSGGSNPSLSALKKPRLWGFFYSNGAIPAKVVHRYSGLKNLYL